MSTHPDGGQQPAPIRPNLKAVPHAEVQGPSARLRRGVNRAMGGRRIRRRSAIRSLVIEQLLIGGTRLASTASYAETVIAALGKAAGDRVLRKTQRLLGSLVRKCDSLRARQVTLRIRARYRDGDIVAHPDGGVQTVIKTAADQDKVRGQVNEDIDRGSYRHRRLPAALRRVPQVVFGADGALLLYFFSGITNVNWGNPLSAALVFAVLLATMVTGISFAFFRFTGDRLQQYKDDTGSIPLRGLDMATNVSVGLSAAAEVVLAALMFLRMRAEVITTLGPHAGFTAIIVGVTLAAAGILANTLVIAVHALDGSAETDRLDAFGKVVGPALAAQHGLLEQAAVLDPAIAVTIREAERVANEGITAAGYERAFADRIIDAGRAVHQGIGPVSEPATDPNDQDGVIGYRRTDATPEVDERPIHHTLDQIHTPITDQPGDEQAAA
jgi:hypothetical protein